MKPGAPALVQYRLGCRGRALKAPFSLLVLPCLLPCPSRSAPPPTLALATSPRAPPLSARPGQSLAAANRPPQANIRPRTMFFRLPTAAVPVLEATYFEIAQHARHKATIERTQAPHKQGRRWGGLSNRAKEFGLGVGVGEQAGRRLTTQHAGGAEACAHIPAAQFGPRRLQPRSRLNVACPLQRRPWAAGPCSTPGPCPRF